MDIDASDFIIRVDVRHRANRLKRSIDNGLIGGCQQQSRAVAIAIRLDPAVGPTLLRHAEIFGFGREGTVPKQRQVTREKMMGGQAVENGLDRQDR